MVLLVMFPSARIF